MRRIGYYLVAWGYGGVEMYLLTLLRHLDRSRFEPIVYFHCSNPSDDARMRGELAKLNVTVKDIDLDGNPKRAHSTQQTAHSKQSSSSARQLVSSSVIGSKPNQKLETRNKTQHTAYSIQHTDGLVRSSARQQSVVSHTRNQKPETRNYSYSAKRALVFFFLPRGIKEILYYRNSASKLAEFLRRERLDIIHFLHGGYPTLGIPVIASRLAEIPVRLSDVHLDPLDVRKMRWAQRWRARQAAASATCVRALSQRMKRQLLDILPALRDRIQVVPNGIDLRRFEIKSDPNGFRASLGIPEDARLVTTLARLDPVKRHRILIEAAASLKNRFPKAHYLFVGDGPARTELESLSTHHGLDRHIHFAGFRADVPAVLNASDAVVLPSLVEGMPLSVLEAMAAGKPVIATDVGANREVLDNLDNGKMGCIVPPGNVEELRQALVDFLSASKETMVAMGKAARQRVMSHYSEQRAIQGLTHLYRP